MDKQIVGRTFDEERALYHLQDYEVADCTFSGPADGESVLKEAGNIRVERCSFSLRYPLWHVKTFELHRCCMDEKTRAAIWYAEDGVITECKLDGIKAVRECRNLRLERCEVRSPEFGWKCSGMNVADTVVESEYLLLESHNIEISNLRMKGKYSFQYTENVGIEDAYLDTKDAFWHSKNVVVRNCILKGEYLGWFSDGLTLIDCKIIGTQPFCYCKNLKLYHCTMEETDLAFEYSDVEADIQGHVQSIKNPKSGLILVDSVGEVICEEAVVECTGKVQIRDVTESLGN